MWLAVVRKCQLILRASDGDEEEGALVAQLAQGLRAGVQLGVTV